jgi:hypothetical protein
MNSAEKNPFAVPVETLLERLAQANRAQRWGITKGVFTHLHETAPTLPEGRLAFLSFRIRLSKGQKGVEQTANTHIREIIRVHGKKKVWWWYHLRTDKKHLRLLLGNKTHKPVVEWCVIDLETHRERPNITAVRGPKSIADEGLVLAWLYPDYPRSIDHKEKPGYFLGGYEMNYLVHDEGPWGRILVVDQALGTGRLGLYAYYRDHADSGNAVPSLRA